MLYGIRVYPYAHPQHLKVLKHFVYIQYVCEMQSMGVCSLNYDTTTSYRLGHTSIILKFTPTCTCDMARRMHPYAHPQHLKVLNHFVYIQYGCGMHSMEVFSLSHGTTTSHRLVHTLFSLKFTPTCTCVMAIRVYPYAPIHSISRC